MQLRRTKLIVDWWCGGLLNFTGHGACYATLAAPLTVGSASTLESHSGLFVLCIFSRGIVPRIKKHHHSQFTQSRSGNWSTNL